MKRRLANDGSNPVRRESCPGAPRSTPLLVQPRIQVPRVSSPGDVPRGVLSTEPRLKCQGPSIMDRGGEVKLKAGAPGPDDARRALPSVDRLGRALTARDPALPAWCTLAA